MLARRRRTSYEERVRRTPPGFFLYVWRKWITDKWLKARIQDNRWETVTIRQLAEMLIEERRRRRRVEKKLKTKE